MQQKWILLAAFNCFLTLSASAQTVRIGVFGIFHPSELTLSVATADSLVVTASTETFYLDSHAHPSALHLRASGNTVEVANNATVDRKQIHAAEIRATNREHTFAEFTLAVPGKLARHYRGVLTIKSVDGILVPVVTMDLETAVASVVQAESASATPLEALKAQAIVSRSYIVAGGGRHADFDFCDLTHCQFLREPPTPDSPAALATAATKGSLIQFEGKTIATMFTRSCSGHTQTLAAIGLTPQNYPYFSVICDRCYHNPVRWTRKLSPQDAAFLSPHTEDSRLSVVRRLGWNAVPSNTFTLHNHGDEIVLEGIGQGHGVGLCQRGASAMAAQGAGFREIIAHYFPNTTITQANASTPR
jgi:stage II sporulation protein D